MIKNIISDNKKKIIYGINLILGITIVAVLIFYIAHKNANADYAFDLQSIYDWSDGWSVSAGQYEDRDVVLPVKLASIDTENVIIKKTLPNKIKKYNCLMFESKHQDVLVNVGGILRTAYSDSGTREFGNLSPNAIVLVPLYSSDEGKDITILISSTREYVGNIDKVYLGNEKSIVLMLIKSNIIWFALCGVALIIGALCIVFWGMFRNTIDEGSTFIGLYFFGTFLAIWCFSQLKIRQMFIKDIHFFDNIGYLCYMLLPFIVTVFSQGIVKTKKHLGYVICYSVATLNFFIQSVLQAIGSYDFYEMIFVTNCVYLGIVIVLLAMRLKDKESSKVAMHVNIGLFALLAGTLIDFVCGILGLNNNIRNISYIGSLIFMVSNIVHIFIKVIEEQQRKKDAENANIAKSQFLATMSHEIRTPINAVLGMNEMILRESNEQFVKEYANNISDAGKSLLSLVNDILDFSKIESGKMDIVCVEYHLKYLLRDLILMIKSRMSTKGLELILKIDETIPTVYFGDEVRIKQVLTNLLTNSAKYTPEGSITFTVENRGIENDEIELYFSVKDTGIGIKKEDIDKLMNSSFIRVDQERNRNIEGTGLGLSITRQLLTLMGSKLEIDSEYGKGSDFHFVLKQKVIDNKAMGSVMDSNDRVNKRKSVTYTAPDAKILAVDDTKTNLIVIRGLLKPYKCIVTTCDSGEKCIELCKNETFDIIFMDHMMPGMDGIMTLKNLRGDNIIGDNTKVIALTANAISGASDLYKESGFDGYITKPIDVEELDECLKEHLQDILIREA